VTCVFDEGDINTMSKVHLSNAILRDCLEYVTHLYDLFPRQFPVPENEDIELLAWPCLDVLALTSKRPVEASR
jgi:hypothetical protein